MPYLTDHVWHKRAVEQVLADHVLEGQANVLMFTTPLQVALSLQLLPEEHK
jgi:hypothetical protein